MFDRLKLHLLQRLDLPRIAARADGAAEAVVHLERAADRSAEIETALARADDDLRTRLDALERWARIERTTIWAAHAPLRHRPLINVVMPTRNRAASLQVAIDSVLAQTYDHWQLVVVDDGSDDGTAGALQRIAELDPRVVVHRTTGIGAAAARNVGLGAATGDWVAFLDDDNTMHPGWLRAVAEYSGREVDCRAMFGVQLRDDVLGGDVVPWVLFDEQMTLERLRLDNTIDLGALAVRADHPELSFDSTLSLYIDWELVVRIAATSTIHPVSVLASLYSNGAPTRITDQHGEDTLEEMRRRLAP
ncbi:MAG: glycosyltransferase family A protein [Ilumatobacteraceae bacterium]